MSSLLYLSAWLAGVFVAKLTDPVGIILVAISAGLGYRRSGVWTALAGAAIAAVITLLAIYSWWERIGVADRWPSRTAFLFFTFVLIALPAYGIGALAYKLTGREK